MQQPEWMYVPNELSRIGKRYPLSDMFQYSATHFGERNAIADGETKYTFAQMEFVTQRIAAALHQAGVRQGDYVLILAETRFLFVRWNGTRSPSCCSGY